MRSTVEARTETLRDHAMFKGRDRLRMIRMCDLCRVTAQGNGQDGPLAMGDRRRPRGTEDCFLRRRDH